MKVLNSEEMSLADRRTIQELGIPSLVLMENASLAVARVIKRKFPEGSKVLVLVGKGNNGGDGLACARHLKLWGYRVDVFLVFGEVKGDALFQLDLLRALGGGAFEGASTLGKLSSYCRCHLWHGLSAAGETTHGGNNKNLRRNKSAHPLGGYSLRALRRQWKALHPKR
jgi:hypothetical protein